MTNDPKRHRKPAAERSSVGRPSSAYKSNDTLSDSATTSEPHTKSASDLVSRGVSPKVYHPLATIKSKGTPKFRSQAARDFACLLDVDPDVASWSSRDEDIDVIFETEVHTVDFVAETADGRIFYHDVDDTLPAGPEWIDLAVGQKGGIYAPVSMEGLMDSSRLLNAKDLLKYGAYRCSLGDRVRILSALDEMGSLTVAEALTAFREGRPMACLAVLILQGFLEVDLDAGPIGPETTVRRIRD